MSLVEVLSSPFKLSMLPGRPTQPYSQFYETKTSVQVRERCCAYTCISSFWILIAGLEFTFRKGQSENLKIAAGNHSTFLAQINSYRVQKWYILLPSEACQVWIKTLNERRANLDVTFSLRLLRREIEPLSAQHWVFRPFSARRGGFNIHYSMDYEKRYTMMFNNVFNKCPS